MRTPRIFHEAPLAEGIQLELGESGANHVARVLRLKEGAAVTLFNGCGGEYNSIITAIDKRRVVVDVETYIDSDVESPIKVTLVQGISRGERMDYTLQKAVELGVTNIVPLITERCMVELKGERAEKRLAHWRGIIIGACEQSGRNRIPHLESIGKLNEWIKQPHGGSKLLLDHMADNAVQHLHPAEEFTILIGPEGGLAPWEKALAMEHGYSGVRLGPRVLRTETAALVALTALQSHFGDLA